MNWNFILKNDDKGGRQLHDNFLTQTSHLQQTHTTGEWTIAIAKLIAE